MSDAAADARPAPDAQPKQIAGFWRRTVALLIDGLVLGVPTYFLAQLAFDQLAELGQAGRLIGLPIMLLYIGVGDSSITGGQTIGKALLALRVVRSDGAAISFLRALLRTLVYAIPLYLNGLYFPPDLFPNDQTMWFAGAMLMLGVFGFGIASLYLFIFNTGTRQALHDLFLETYVVKASAEGAIEPRVWIGHIGFVMLLFAAILASPILMQSYVGTARLENEPYASLNKIQQRLAEDPEFLSVEVQTSTVSFYSTKESKTTRFLDVQVQLKRRAQDTDAVIREIARKVLRESPDIMGMDELAIKVGIEVDLGIMRFSDEHRESNSVEEWRKLLNDVKPGTPA